MRTLILTALAALMTLVSVSEADARRRSSTTENLVFVAPTGLPAPEGGELSLCMLTKQESAMFINFWLSAETYALAENACQANGYMAVDAAMLAEMQAAGIVPADLPATPRLTASQVLNGFWGLGAGVALLAFFALGAFKKSQRKKQRIAAMGDASPQAIRILDVLCHAAKADGEIDDAEVTTIARIAEQVTGTRFDEAQVARMIELSEEKMEASDFAALTKGLDAEGARLAMRGALMVCAADGHLAGAEQAFIGGLSQALSIGADEINSTLNSLSGGQAAPA